MFKSISSLNSILQWVSKSKNQKLLLFSLIIGLGIFAFTQHQKVEQLHYENSIKDSNVQAIKSELISTTDKLGNVVAEKGALQGELEEIKDLNTTLFDSLEYLHENPVTVTNIKYITVPQPIYDIETAGKYLGENKFKLSWEYNNSGTWGRRTLEGITRFTIVGDTTVAEATTDIVRDVMEMNITTGFRETDEGMLRVYARTDYPGAKFLEVEGAIINPRNYVESITTHKRWGIGPFIGTAINPKFQIHTVIGVSIHYSFYQW